MKRKELSIEFIKKGLKDSNWRVRSAAMNACQGKDVPLEFIEKGLKDSDRDVRSAAINACQGKDVPLEFIEKWLKDSNFDVRSAAMNACQGKDVPLEFIKKGLKDGDWRVRSAAINACQKNGINIPVIRTFEPPEKVYKKCLCGIIVVAEIPTNAHIRGREGEKCRSSEVIVVDIIGDICGEKVGISKHDMKTIYEIGDHVVIDNFDYSNVECSTGYHFFCTKKEAENYN
jgi:HEAT repeat protein